MGGWLKDLEEPIRREILAIALIGLGVLSFFAIFSTNPGVVGGFFKRVLQSLLGQWGAILIALTAAGSGLRMLLARKTTLNKPRMVGIGMMVIVFLAFIHRSVPGDPLWAYVRNGWTHQLGGGALGGLLTVAFVAAFGATGRDLLLVFMSILAIPLIFNMSLGGVVLRTGQVALRWVGGGLSALRDFVIEEVEEQESEQAASEESDPVSFEDDDADDGSEKATLTLISEDYSGHELVIHGPPVLHVDSTADAVSSTEKNSSGSLDNGVHGKNSSQGLLLPAPSSGHRPSAYRLPPVSLLKRGPTPNKEKNLRKVRAKANQLEETLASFGVKVKVVGIQEGPAVTRYELEPAVGVRVSKVQNLSSDIALSLAAPDVRIEAPIPGKSLIGIEVPNRQISPVYLRDVLDHPEFRDHPSHLTIALGKDIAGQPVVTSMERMVHLLVAGATGSGKSVCINILLSSLLFKATPDQVRLLLIDPKMVELSAYNGIPHLLAPVVTDPKKAASSLQWLVREMTRRYHLFADCGVRDIGRYNEYAQGSGLEALPYIVVVIDELADLMMVSPVEVEDAIQRLAQMARAAGIHLVVATQRPSVDVITGVIKANIPSRIAFAVSSQADSRVILDLAGAEKLVGKGDMLFFPMGASKPVRVQGAYVSEAELEAVLDFVRNQGRPEYDEEVLQVAEQPEGDFSADEEDELFAEAVRLVLEAGQASVSMLQRRLRVGYTRAGRLIDMMEERGLVGPHQGSKAREVRITMEEYRRMFE